MTMLNLPPTVCLDAATVRRIREEKRLTQLYVAKVAGVTTDTISRWENNRYPTVKRENALRLSEALEVPVSMLILENNESAAATEPQQTLPHRQRRRQIFIFLLVLSAVIAWFVFRRTQAPLVHISLTAQRLLPPHAAPGNIVPVRIRIDTGGEPRGFILREHFPRGWKLIEAFPPASSLDNDEGTVRWMVKPGENRTVIAYLLRVDSRQSLGTISQMQGEVVASSADGKNAPSSVLGTAQLSVAPYLWADRNGDNSVDDAEMLDASYVVEEMGGVHLDWKQLEGIWDAGRYRWEVDKKQFIPLKDSP
ncbi:MAG TPA: XRE family transcriptional regulator [Desulfuromonas sp.]|nr:XRE family transcriptional regulator [Desulfuromonas sp.]